MLLWYYLVIMNNEKRKKRLLTREYLLRATYSYLQRFATTEKNLRLVLDRKVRRQLPEFDSEDLYIQAKVWIDEIVQKTVDQKLVNDRLFAEGRAASLIRSGHSKMKASQKLQAKGVAPDMVIEVIEELAEQYEDMDFAAAVKYVRKRRFGAFSLRHEATEVVEKELASMCRAGFSYGTARKILKMTRSELEEILYAAP